MNTNPQTKEVTERVSWGRLLMAVFVMMALPAVIIFVSSGSLTWDIGWIYVALTAAFTLGGRIIMRWKTPDLIVERGQAFDKEDTEPWDRKLMPLVIIGPVVMLIVAGLDERFGWSPSLPLMLHVSAFVITALGYTLSTWATLVNRFFSAVVRIQRERGHSVVTSGPYKFVRHPGYAGGMMTNFAIPLLLGSLWALVPGVIVNCIFIVRTVLEDKTLQEELDGYREYAERVRYRLLPGVW